MLVVGYDDQSLLSTVQSVNTAFELFQWQNTNYSAVATLLRMSLQLSKHKPRHLQYSAGGLRTDLKLLEVDEKLLQTILSDQCVWRFALQALAPHQKFKWFVH